MGVSGEAAHSRGGCSDVVTVECWVWTRDSIVRGDRGMWLCVCRDWERGMDGVEEEASGRRASVEGVEVFVASEKGVEVDVGNFGICKMAITTCTSPSRTV